MKKYFSVALGVAAAIAMSLCTYAGTIINVPIDSRPVSDEYLGRLAAIGGDKYLSVSKENMDIFPADSTQNKMGNSKAVRKELNELAAANNDEATTVIISTTSYVTNGLVGSRCGANYADYTEALEELKKTAQTYNKPKYYVYMPMPRALPETRLNTIWYDNNKARGLADYYLAYNQNCSFAQELEKYTSVEPAQLLMEYGYVENKALKKGGCSKLEKWEKAFIEDFNNKYKNDVYNPYIESYILPYKATADMFDILMSCKDEGLIDEIIIGNDDLQLPNSIKALYNNGVEIDKENGSPIKYSFAESYMESIERALAKREGIAAKAMAELGKNKDVNIIRGADELPQLIYARDYTKRNDVSPKYNIVYNAVGQQVDEFDVITPQQIARAATAFVGGGIGKYTAKPFDLYIFDYSDYIKYYQGSFTKSMRESIKNGNNVGLIELFDFGHPTNLIYKDMLSTGSAINIKNIDMYSAWNTNANAIGLGVAQAQVWAVAQEKSTAPEASLKAQLEALAQHCYEDGEYTAHGKLTLVNAAYRPTESDSEQCPSLRATLNENGVINAMVGGKYKIGDKVYELDALSLEKASLPWRRTFDCYIETKADLAEK